MERTGNKGHDMKLSGYLVGIDGEILLGLGRTADEAWADARVNGSETIAQRGDDVQLYEVYGESEYLGYEEHGDGYNHNAFSESARAK